MSPYLIVCKDRLSKQDQIVATVMLAYKGIHYNLNRYLYSQVDTLLIDIFHGTYLGNSVMFESHPNMTYIYIVIFEQNIYLF